jgi:hypothetical protein
MSTDKALSLLDSCIGQLLVTPWRTCFFMYLLIPKVKRSKKSVSSSSESESSDSSSTSKSDQESSDNLPDTETSRPFKPKLKNKKVVSTKVPKHGKKYIER